MAAYANAQLANKDATRSTALKLYTGEVIKAFREKNIALELIKSRSISGGKTSQFIVTGAAKESDIQTHVRGTDVTPVLLANDEVTITVDTRYVHSHFIDALDEKLAQYEVRGELASQSGQVLATKIDKDVFKMLAGAAPYTADKGVYSTTTIKPGMTKAGKVELTGYSAAATAQAAGDLLVAGMYKGKAELNKRNVTDVPSVVVSPVDYYNLVQSTRGVNSDYTSGNGGIDTGKIRQIAGFSVAWTNHLADAGTPIIPKLVGMMFTKDVAGVVKAMDITSEANYIPEKLGHLLVSFYALGMGPLNPTGFIALLDK